MREVIFKREDDNQVSILMKARKKKNIKYTTSEQQQWNTRNISQHNVSYRTCECIKTSYPSPKNFH